MKLRAFFLRIGFVRNSRKQNNIVSKVKFKKIYQLYAKSELNLNQFDRFSFQIILKYIHLNSAAFLFRIVFQRTVLRYMLHIYKKQILLPIKYFISSTQYSTVLNIQLNVFDNGAS